MFCNINHSYYIKLYAINSSGIIQDILLANLPEDAVTIDDGAVEDDTLGRVGKADFSDCAQELSTGAQNFLRESETEP